MNLLIEGNNSHLSLRESSEKAANTNATFAERKATILRLALGFVIAVGQSQLPDQGLIATYDVEISLG